MPTNSLLLRERDINRSFRLIPRLGLYFKPAEPGPNRCWLRCVSSWESLTELRSERVKAKAALQRWRNFSCSK